MSQFRILVEPVSTQRLLQYTARQFQTEAEAIRGKGTLRDGWIEKPISNYAEAYNLFHGKSELIHWLLQRWHKNRTKKAEFNPGLCTKDSIHILAFCYKQSEYLSRLKYMRFALELLKLGDEPRCPRTGELLKFPETPAALHPNAISIDHCLPMTSGFRKTQSPISICSWASNQTRGDLPWPVWMGCPCTENQYQNACEEAQQCLRQYTIKTASHMTYVLN